MFCHTCSCFATVWGVVWAQFLSIVAQVRDIWGRSDLGEVKVGGAGGNTTWAIEKVASHDSAFLVFSPIPA